jgi:hypothetical protein
MTVVCDMGPLHYLVLIGAEYILPQLYTRVLTLPAVISELSRPATPEAVRDCERGRDSILRFSRLLVRTKSGSDWLRKRVASP